MILIYWDVNHPNGSPESKVNTTLQPAEGHVWAEREVGYAAVCAACKMLQSPCKPDQVVLRSCPHQNGPSVPPRVSSVLVFCGDAPWEMNEEIGFVLICFYVSFKIDFTVYHCQDCFGTSVTATKLCILAVIIGRCQETGIHR